MQKDFDLWNENKKRIESEKINKHYKVRDIWWCSLGVNIGDEHDGDGTEYQRPVLILRGLSLKTCLVLPLTSSLSKHPMRVPIGDVDGKEASAILSQMRVIDTKRLLGKVGYISQDMYENVRKAAKDIL